MTPFASPNGLPQLGLDPGSTNYNLLGGSKLSDWAAMENWVVNNIK
jgi:hypothetical protein